MHEYQTNPTVPLDFTRRRSSAAWHPLNALLAALLLAGLAWPAGAQTWILGSAWSAANGVGHLANNSGNRGLAYGAASNQVYVATRNGASSAIDVFDGTTGALLSGSGGVSGAGTVVPDQIGVADDGVLYAMPLDTGVSTASPLQLYRWANWNSPPSLAYTSTNSSDPVITTFGTKRIGDTMAVTGSGVNTLILAGVGGQGTNFVLLHTADGVNFTSTVVLVPTGLPSTAGNVFGISFYTNGTFLVLPGANASSHNVYLVSYPANFASQTSVTGTVLGNAGTLTANLTCFLDYAPAGQMLAVAQTANQSFNTNGIFSMTNFPATAAQLASTNFATPNANINATGGAALGGQGKTNFLYVLESNNGLQAYSINFTVAAIGPTISTQPLGLTNAFPPQTVTVQVSGTAPFHYQWYEVSGGATNAVGANTNFYTVPTPATNFYFVVITNAALTANTVTSSVVGLSLLTPVTNVVVSQLWTRAAGSFPFLTTGNNTRGLTYDTNTHRVIVASYVSGSTLYLLDGDTGASLGNMNMTGTDFPGLISGVDQVGAADDGAIYAGNLVNAGASFKLYRWNAADTTTTSTLAYTGDPGSGSGDRWGDTMAVRGAGAATQILIGSKGTNMVFFKGNGVTFAPLLIAITNVPPGFCGSGIAFGASNTFWAKAYGGDLYEVAFDTNSLTGGAVLDFSTVGQIPSPMSGVGVDPVNNIYGGVNLSNVNNDLELFQLTGTSDPPVLFDQTFFPSYNANVNQNAAVTMKYPRAYALDVNNGIVAVSYGVPALTAAPQTFFTGGPAQHSTVCSLPTTFTWSGSDNVTAPANLLFAYQLDGAGFSVFSNWTSLTLSNLSDGAHVISVEAQNEAASVDPTPATISFTVNLLPPHISAVSNTPPAGYQCAIAWTTDEAATSQVEYGTTTSYGTLTSINGSLVTAHSYLLTGLLPATTYHYRAHSQNPCGLEATSGDFTLTIPPDTTPPDTFFTGGPGQNGTVCSLPTTFTWSGSDDVTGPANLLFAYRLDGAGFSVFSNWTSLTLSNLSEGPHTVSVEAQDQAGNVDPTPANMSFTVSLLPLHITAVSNDPPTDTQCAITWTTDEAATSQLEYGTNTSYGTSISSSFLVTAHPFLLMGLVPGTTYHYRAHSQNPCGPEVISGDFTFTTPPDTTPPHTVLTNLPGQNGIVCSLPTGVGWSGSDDVTALTNLLFAYRLDGAGFSVFSNWTSLAFSSLSEGPHTFSVEARDQAGNVDPIPASVDFTVDTLTPSISNLGSSAGPNYVVVTWRTSKAAGSLVDYGLSSAYGQSVSSSQLVSNHSVTVSGLQPTTTYHFRVTSVDECSRSAVSGDNQITTPPPPDLQVRSVSAPGEAYTGSGFNVSWVDTNAGQNTAFGPWVDRVYLSHTNGLNASTDQLLGEFPFLNQLSPNQAAALTHSVSINRAGLTNGTYYISVFTDATNGVYEGVFETNNVGVSATTIAVQLTPLPDLVVSQISAPTNALGGQTIDVSWTVCNQGTGDTDVPLWYDHLYLSSTTNLNGVVADYGTFANPGYLAPDECYDQVATITLPVGIGGEHYFLVTADSTGLVGESSETNNTTADTQPISIQEVLPGFLHVTSVQVAPAPPTPVWAGQDVTVTWTVKNTGQSEITGMWDDEVTLSPTPTYDFINGYWDVLNHIYFTNSSLAPGESYSHSGTFPVPQDAAPGNWYAVPIVDTHFLAGGIGAVGSGAIGRDQNSTLVLVVQAPQSDLEMTRVTATPTSAYLGASITVGWSVTNTGINLTSANAWYDRVYLCPVTPFNLSLSVNLGSFLHSGMLDIGQGYSASRNVTVPLDYMPTNSPSTTNYLYVATDSGNVVIELTKTNNVLTAPQPIIISQTPPADLAVTSITIPAVVVAGTTANVSWSVTNQGSGPTSAAHWVDSVYLSQTPVLNPSAAVHLADVPHTGDVLLPGGSYMANQVFSVPYCPVGLFYVVVVTDSGRQVFEGGALANNTLSSPQQLRIYPSKAARIEVASVSPSSSVQAGSPLPVSWTVQNAANAAPNVTWFDAVYLSPGPQFVPGNSYLLGVYPHTGGLGSNATYMATQSPVVPHCFSGNYYVTVIADVTNIVDSISCDTNNLLTAVSSTTVLPSSYPSLQVTGLTLPPGANAGTPWTVQWTVTNAGPGAASGVWSDAVYASLLPTLDTSALVLGQFTYSNGLPSGAIYSQSESVAFPACIGGSFYIYVVTDVGNVVNGPACQPNNQAASGTPLVVNFGAYPDLTVAGVGAPDTAYAGQPVAVSWSVTNSGFATAIGPWVDSVYLFPGSVFSPSNSIFLGAYPQTQPLAPGVGYSQTVSPTLPSIQGTYNVAVVTDSSNNVQECQGENNNTGYGAGSVNVPVTLYADLKVTSVQIPGNAYAGQTISVTWVVTNEGTDTTGGALWGDAL